MTATERLRALLDERGVEHFDGTECTLWGYEPRGACRGAYRFSADETSGGAMQLIMYRVTPKQAVEATLGRKTCRNVTTDAYSNHFECSECHCIVEDSEMYYVKVYERGKFFKGNTYGWNFCPNCGRNVVDA